MGQEYTCFITSATTWSFKALRSAPDPSYLHHDTNVPHIPLTQRVNTVCIKSYEHPCV